MKVSRYNVSHCGALQYEYGQDSRLFQVSAVELALPLRGYHQAALLFD